MPDHDHHDHQHAELTELTEEGRRLASQREDLIAAGVDPNDLEIPIAPLGVEIQTLSQFVNSQPGETITTAEYLRRGGEPSTLDHADDQPHHTRPAHDAPRTHAPAQATARPPFGVSAFERAQWRRDSENGARGIVSLNARVLALLDALDQAEAALRSQKTKRRRIRQRADQLLAERDLARRQVADARRVYLDAVNAGLTVSPVALRDALDGGAS